MSFDLVDIGIKKAAALCRGDRFAELTSVCCDQKRIGARRLKRIVAELVADSTVDGVFVKKLVDEIRKLRKQIASTKNK